MKDDHVGWDSAFNADCLGKGLHHSSEINKRREGSFVGEIEQKGGEEVFKHQDSTDVGSPLVNQGVRPLDNSRVVLDASYIGFKHAELIGSVNNILDSDLEDGLIPETLIPCDESLSWEERVDRLNGSNPGNSSEARDIIGVETEMERGSTMEFPEFHEPYNWSGKGFELKKFYEHPMWVFNT
ncbi:hypothetical protein V6N11_071426 [Hibiscus sabdariffa]|uniref:Uncharacterized protein n=1 Tax=Hibiscus sabdariffa TaxID=183260 RepID=A0ABR2U048_9ROSI